MDGKVLEEEEVNEKVGNEEVGYEEDETVSNNDTEQSLR